MEIFKWLLALLTAALGAVGLGMSLCGGWFIAQDIVAIFSKSHGYESIVAMIAVGSILIGAVFMFLARLLFLRLGRL